MASTAFQNGAAQLFYPKAFFFSLSIAIFSYRRCSLQLSGAVAATLIGYLTLANPNPIFGSALLTFFAAGTIATKYKKSFKSSLVDEVGEIPVDHDDEDTKRHQRAPQIVKKESCLGRDWKQVLCNSWFGTICAIAYGSLLRYEEDSLKLNNLDPPLVQKALVSAALTYWAGCAGDTLASELGILARTKPRLITNMKEVPPGTNGGVSLLGLGFSILGGVIIGAVSCWVGERHQSRGHLIIYCSAFGLLCSMIDSILGATLQQTLYSKTEGRVIAKNNTQLGGNREVIIICGYDWLTNNQVNLISSTLVGVLAGLLSYCSLVT